LRFIKNALKLVEIIHGPERGKKESFTT